MSQNYYKQLQFQYDHCDHDDNVYFNARLYNPTGVSSSLEADFFETRQNEILCGDLSDYQMAVVRMAVPQNNLPIFFFKNNTYVVTLRHSGVDYPATVIYTSQNTFDPNFRGVFNIQHMLDMINTALATAFASIAPATATGPPIFLYDAVQERIYMEVENAYVADGIQLFVNYSLFNFLQGMNIIFNGYDAGSNKDIEIIIKDNGNNLTAGILRMDTEYQNIVNWFDNKGLVITTTTIPVDLEFINTTDINRGGDDVVLPIMKDFINTRKLKTIRADFIYEQVGPYQWIDLNSPGNQGLRKIQFQVFSQSIDGSLRPISISPNSALTAKLLFRRKTFANSFVDDGK